MKNLTHSDLSEMITDEFAPDDRAVEKQVRKDLKLGQLIPKPLPPVPDKIILDWHGKTLEYAWGELEKFIRSGSRSATIITGASGIMKTKFQEWIANSIITPHVATCKQLNNGAFEVKLKRNRT